MSLVKFVMIFLWRRTQLDGKPEDFRGCVQDPHFPEAPSEVSHEHSIARHPARTSVERHPEGRRGTSRSCGNRLGVSMQGFEWLVPLCVQAWKKQSGCSVEYGGRRSVRSLQSNGCVSRGSARRGIMNSYCAGLSMHLQRPHRAQ